MDMGGMKYGAGLSMEERLARLEQQALLQSLLSSNGQMIVHNGTSIVAAGSTARMKIGTFTITATGNKVVTGVGFKPSLVAFHYLPASSGTNLAPGDGMMDAAGNQFVRIMATDDGVGASQNSATDGCIGLPASFTAGTFFTKAAYVSMDTDGFTINVGTHGGGTFTFAYVAHR